MKAASADTIPRFERQFFSSRDACMRIGDGALGGKAQGLVFIRDVLGTLAEDVTRGSEVGIPRMVVVATSMFDAFIARNDLWELALSDLPDERIAHAFQQADLPVEMLGDLRALMDEAHAPLAVRSSSLLEDALFRPFAGVYSTKMIPNNQPDRDTRFRKLIEAIKFVYASTFFAAAKSYVRATDRTTAEEKMAVIIQEVLGRRHEDRFYPDISGVARSFNFYPTGHARADQGVCNLALGLGKTIVDGGISWSYSPAYPKAPPPFGSAADLLKNTQTRFWAVNMGQPPEYDPIAETEYLVEATLGDAEHDGVLDYLVSTYDGPSDRLVPGIGVAGPRVLDFAPVLVTSAMPVNALVRALLAACDEALSAPVEIEFAITVEPGSRRARFGFLQVRPMVISDERVEIQESELSASGAIVASSAVMGDGVEDSITDVVYVKPASFEARLTRVIAQEIDRRNTALLAEQRPYVLIGFGRWGSSDPWLGIPVRWGQICGARVIVEATLPEMDVEASQGAHFFHNISSFGVSYLTVHHRETAGIDWACLDGQPAIEETEYIRHVRFEDPLLVKVDGRNRRGGIWRQH